MYNETIDYYNMNTEEFIGRTIHADMSICQEKFLKLLKKGACILDAGCGSGRDSKFFLEQGMEVQAIDASQKMCQAASEYIGQSVECMRFDELKAKEEYDGIWACASLLHVEKSELPTVLTRFHCALKPNGVLYASFKYGTTEERRLGRFFSDYQLDELEQVFLHHGLYKLIEKFETEDVRTDYKDKPWINIIVQKN